jgi:hypothetical protein
MRGGGSPKQQSPVAVEVGGSAARNHDVEDRFGKPRLGHDANRLVVEADRPRLVAGGRILLDKQDPVTWGRQQVGRRQADGAATDDASVELGRQARPSSLTS